VAHGQPPERAERAGEHRLVPEWALPLVVLIALAVVTAAIVGLIFAGVLAGLAVLVAGGVLTTAVALILGIGRPRSLL